MKFNFKFNRQQIFILFLLIPIFKPAGLSYYSNLDLCFKLWKICSLCIMLFFVIYSIKRIQLDIYLKGIINLGFFWLIYLINCLRFHASYGDILNNAVTSIVLLLFFRYIFIWKQWKILFDCLDVIFTSWIFFQVVSLVYIKDGRLLFEPLEDGFTYFLGMDNYSAFATLLMIGILFYIDCVRFKEIKFSKKNLILLAMLIFGYLYVRSITAILAFVLLASMVFLKKYWKIILQFITVKRTFFLTAILLFLVVAFNVQNLIAGFLSSALLGKGSYGLTLNSRTIIWSQAIDMISCRPFFGYGALTEAQISAHALYGASHTHNIFMELLFRTGIIGTFLYLNFIFLSLKSKWKGIFESERSILSITLIAYIILSFMDFYPTMQYIYCFIGLVYCSHYFEKETVCIL